MPDGTPVLGVLHQYEFEPLQYQASAQALIPKPIRQIIHETRKLCKGQGNSEFVTKLSPVQQQNMRESVGSFAHDHYYAFLGKQLNLWKSATKTKHGVNVFKEGNMIVSSAPSERQRAVNHLN